MIDKLVKEFEKIRASLAKSKKLILVDIDKIDEKYRKLAQEEKKSLTESLAILNEQLKYYDKMLDGKPVVEETSEESVDADTMEDAPKEEEKAIEDTIFPENNEPEETSVDEEKKGMIVEEVVSVLEDAGIKNIDTVAEEPKEELAESVEVTNDGWFGENTDDSAKNNEEEPIPVIETDANGWPMPADWK